MLRPLRTLASAKLAWFTLAQTLAPGAVATTHARTVKDRLTGEPVTIQVTRAPRFVVTTGALNAGALLLKLWLKHAQRVQATPQLWSEVELNDAGVPQLPPLYTSGRELAQKLRCTDRSVRNYVRELKGCGLIERYRFRGREHAYCLWVKPDFVWETPLPVLTTPESAASGAAATTPHGKNFPVKEPLEALEAQKSAISGVDKLVTARGADDPTGTGSPLTGSAESPSACQPGTQAAKSGAGGAGAARAERFYRRAHERGTGAKKAEAMAVVSSLWTYAKALIYKGRSFTAEQERRAKNALWAGVFHGFQRGEPADWQQWLRPLRRRVELAAAWFQRNPAKYPALPYAEVLTGTGYFDADNPRGFAATARWQQDEERHHRQGVLERALDEALTELQQRRRLDAGQRRVQASKRVRQKELSELHRFHQTRLRRLGGEEALYRFAARLQAEQLLTLPA